MISSSVFAQMPVLMTVIVHFSWGCYCKNLKLASQLFLDSIQHCLRSSLMAMKLWNIFWDKLKANFVTEMQHWIVSNLQSCRVVEYFHWLQAIDALLSDNHCGEVRVSAWFRWTYLVKLILLLLLSARHQDDSSVVMSGQRSDHFPSIISFMFFGMLRITNTLEETYHKIIITDY